jgi:DNA invertase Pin-like site-specific DNA recombinase
MENSQIAIVSVPLTEWNEHKALLQDISNQVRTLTSRDQKELMTPKEVCEMLKIGRTTFERYMNDSVFEVIQVNKKKYSKKYVKRSHLEDLIRDGKV